MHVTRRSILTGAGTALVTAVIPLPAGAAGKVAGHVMGTTWSAIVTHAPGTCADVIAQAFAKADGLFSPYRPETDLSRLNASATGGTVDPELVNVVAAGLEFARKTGGAFNPAIGGVVGRLGFGPIRSPTSAWTDMDIDGTYVAKADPAVTFDPCGIAKGRALDMAANALAAHGHSDFLIELGGEIVTRGEHPDGRPWQLGIERPDPNHQGILRTVSPGNRALATSADWFHAYAVAGRRVHHIVDPRTLAPSRGLASVSVIAPTAMAADAWATALMTMGPEDGPAFAETHDLPVLFVARDGNGLREIMAPAMERHIVA